MINKTVLAALCCLPSLVSHAAWNLVNNYESDVDKIPFWHQTALTDGPLPGQFMGPYPDFMNPDNQVVAASPGLNGLSTNHLTFLVPLSPNIPQGATGTIFFRFAIFGYSINVAVGPSYEEIRTEADGLPWPRVWDQLTTYMVVTDQVQPQEQIAIHDGSGTPGNRKTPNSSVEPGYWYKVWIVVNNLDKTAQWYVQSPADPEPKRLLIPIFDGTTQTDQVKEITSFRNNQLVPGDLKSFMVITTNLRDKHQGDYYLMDDLYVDTTGVNLTDPLSGDPCAIFSSEGWYVYNDVFGVSSVTGEFYYTGFCPFIWDFGKNTWLYFFTPTDGSSYVFNFADNQFYFAWQGAINPLLASQSRSLIGGGSEETGGGSSEETGGGSSEETGGGSSEETGGGSRETGDGN